MGLRQRAALREMEMALRFVRGLGLGLAAVLPLRSQGSHLRGYRPTPRHIPAADQRRRSRVHGYWSGRDAPWPARPSGTPGDAVSSGFARKRRELAREPVEAWTKCGRSTRSHYGTCMVGVSSPCSSRSGRDRAVTERAARSRSSRSIDTGRQRRSYELRQHGRIRRASASASAQSAPASDSSRPTRRRRAPSNRAEARGHVRSENDVLHAQKRIVVADRLLSSRARRDQRPQSTSPAAPS